MSRRLTGSVSLRGNRWRVTLPDAKGSTGRRTESFWSEDDARSWLALALVAVQAGEAFPDPDRFRTTPPPPRTPKPAAPGKGVALPVGVDRAPVAGDIAAVSAAWMAAAYNDLRRAGPDRADQVRRVVETHIVPWFAPRTSTVADITYYMVHDWLLHLVARHPTDDNAPPAESDRPGLVDENGEVTLAEAARRCGMSVPTLRRRWRTGQLPGAHRDRRGNIRVPARALDTVKIAPGSAGTPAGLSRSYVSGALWALRRILAFARANGLMPAGFDPTESLDAPAPDPSAALRKRPPTAKARPITLPECARVAAHLHPVHQIALWLQRIMGMRISEAFGVLLTDIVELDDVGMLAAQGQGGRIFRIRDDHGQVVAVPHKGTMKTAAGSRVLIAPPKLMDLIRLTIEAFHTDPDTGHVIDAYARLIPGVARPNESGQAAYRHSLDDALTAEGLSSRDLGFDVTTHLLRKSLATDLAWQAGIDPTVRRRFLGHRAGDDVYGRIYTLDHPEVAPLVEVAAILDAHITDTIGTLVTPTTRPIHWGKANPIATRVDHVNAVLGTSGWQVDPGDPDDPLRDAKRAGHELGVDENTARRWMNDGTLPYVTQPDVYGVPRRYTRLSVVWAHRDRLANRTLLTDLAETLGVRYHEVYTMMRRLDLDVPQHPTSREYELTPQAAQAITAEHHRIRALHQRSVRLSAVARQLKVAASTASLLAKAGNLTIDPETDTSGATFVTRTSVDACWITRTAGRRQIQRTAVPIAEVSRFTGYPTAALMDLVRAGVLEQLPGRRAGQLTDTSLRAWMTSRDPENPEGITHDPAVDWPTADGTVVPFGGRRDQH